MTTPQAIRQMPYVDAEITAISNQIFPAGTIMTPSDPTHAATDVRPYVAISLMTRDGLPATGILTYADEETAEKSRRWLAVNVIGHKCRIYGTIWRETHYPTPDAYWMHLHDRCYAMDRTPGTLQLRTIPAPIDWAPMGEKSWLWWHQYANRVHISAIDIFPEDPADRFRWAWTSDLAREGKFTATWELDQEMAARPVTLWDEEWTRKHHLRFPWWLKAGGPIRIAPEHPLQNRPAVA